VAREPFRFARAGRLDFSVHRDESYPGGDG
jgi:hypothetical protein